MKTNKTPIDYANTLDTVYGILTVRFILHVSMPIQLIHYRPKLNSPHNKILGELHGENPTNFISHC